MKISSSVLSKALALLAIVMLGLSMSALAQSSSDDLGPTKFDLFAGYSYMAPGGQIGGVNLKDMPAGWAVAPTWNFNRTFGLTFDASGHYGDNADVGTIRVGRKLTLHMGRVAPFGEFLPGMHPLSPSVLSSNNAFRLVAGFGSAVRL